jgi:hypothetical protein
MDNWSATLANGPAHVHVFRKTSLQYVRCGEDINRQVANDARVSESLLMTSYVKETDEELRQASNRTFARILANLSAELARRCSYTARQEEGLEERFRKPVEGCDWSLAAKLTPRRCSPAG